MLSLPTFFLLHSLTSSDETKERLLRILYKKGKNGHVLIAGNGSAPCNINLMEKTEFEIAASMLRGKLVDIARFYLSDEDEAEDIVQEAMLKLWLVRDDRPGKEHCSHGYDRHP